MSRAVADATVLAFLARLCDLHMLDELFKSINVPYPIYEEVVHRGREEAYSEAIAVEDAAESFLDIRSRRDDRIWESRKRQFERNPAF
jgi:predicted nucleic acid-binding protein